MPHVTAPIPTVEPPRRLIERVGAVLLLALAYFLGAKLSQVAAAAHAVVSSFWPPAGIAVFALLRFGAWMWPGIALGAFVFNATNGVPPVGAAAIAAGNSLSGVVAYYLMKRVGDMRPSLDRVRDVLVFAALAAVVSTLLSSGIGALSLELSHAAPPGEFSLLWLAWWTGDAVGILVVTPLLLMWTQPVRFLQHRAWRGTENVLWMVALVVVTNLIFINPHSRAYAVFPLVTAIALRLGRRGAATAVALVTIIATWHTVTSSGPFADSTALINLFSLQLFIGLLSVPSLLFAAARTEVLNSRERLRESDQQYRALAGHLPSAAVGIYDRNMRFRLVEGPVVERVGFTKEGMEGNTIWKLFSPDDAAMLAERLSLAFDDKTDEFEFEYSGHAFLVRVLPLPAEGPTQLGMVLAVDITERTDAERELRESRARLEALARRVLVAQEGERRRIAREVHDELGQALTGVKLALAGLLEREQEADAGMPSSGERRREDGRRGSDHRGTTIRSVSKVVDGAIGAIKEIILRLRPGVLDNLGPIAAVEWEVQQFRNRSGLRTHLRIPRASLDLDGDRSIMLFRVVQEGLTNVLRHANATSVTVELDIDHDEFVLRITDDGRGIGKNDLSKPEAVGILGMRERASALGGTLDLRRGEKGGTVLHLRVPLVAPAPSLAGRT